MALPLLDEQAHPRLGTYAHEHTRAWAATVDAADAVVVVTPEYNHSFPASVKNALDFLYNEWVRQAGGLRLLRRGCPRGPGRWPH